MIWQLSLVGLMVVAAAAYLTRRAWRTWGRKASGCGGCGSGCKGESRSRFGTVGAVDSRPSTYGAAAREGLRVWRAAGVSRLV